MIHKSDYGWE